MQDGVIASFYKFVRLPDCEVLQARVLASCRHRELKGTILLAQEGINGTIAGPRTAVQSVLKNLRTDPRLADLEHRESRIDQVPFRRMRVRLRDEIVTFGNPAVNPTKRVGRYVEPANWNELIREPETLVVDTRNAYEVKIGTFIGAIDPDISSFREFPDFVRDRFQPVHNRKIALFCTGGIRCEKATAHLLASGFEEVYHLRGGILRYLAEIPADESLWRGECFVFDERVAVGPGLEAGSYCICKGCGRPVAKEHGREEEDCCLNCAAPSHHGVVRPSSAAT